VGSGIGRTFHLPPRPNVPDEAGSVNIPPKMPSLDPCWIKMLVGHSLRSSPSSSGHLCRSNLWVK